MDITIRMSDTLLANIKDHLLPENAGKEEAGFAFTAQSDSESGLILDVVNWHPLKEDDFAYQYGDYLELTDQARSKIIKHAHTTNTALIEFHSHLFPYPAAFSFADKTGLQEFVPHVMWRLPNRPYCAIVVAPDGFDSLFWENKSVSPLPIKRIMTETQQLTPTNHSFENWSYI